MNISVSSTAETVQDFMRANETLSTFLLTNSSMSPAAVDQLMKARLNMQVRYWLHILRCQRRTQGPFNFQLPVQQKFSLIK